MRKCIAIALCAAALLAAGDAGAQTAGRGDAAATDRDFDRVNPGIGFGWFGNAPIAGLGAGGANATLDVPVLGIRWWMGAPMGPFRAWGLDLGVGVNRTSSDAQPNDVTRTGFLLHAGLPLVVSANRHMAIELVPEVDLGFASGKDADGTDLGGSVFRLGARAGAEIFFGFIGLPQLALEGSVGIFLARESLSREPPGGASTDFTTWSFATSVQNQPWQLFTGNVAARYYF